MELRKYSYERLDGSIRPEERFVAIRSFSQKSVRGSCKSKADQSGAFVFMISTRAGGVGLNLVAADTVSTSNIQSIIFLLPSLVKRINLLLLSPEIAVEFTSIRYLNVLMVFIVQSQSFGHFLCKLFFLILFYAHHILDVT